MAHKAKLWREPFASAARAGLIVGLASLACLPGGCVRPPAASPAKPTSASGGAAQGSPFVQALRPLDPADEANWPEGDVGPGVRAGAFAGFIRFAETHPEWVLIEMRGEAIFVRCATADRKIVFEEGSNKIVRMDAAGGVEILSMRQYSKADRIGFDLSGPTLRVWGNESRVKFNWDFPAIPPLAAKTK